MKRRWITTLKNSLNSIIDKECNGGNVDVGEEEVEETGVETIDDWRRRSGILMRWAE